VTGVLSLPDGLWKPILGRFGCLIGVRVGWGGSEVQAAFVTTTATTPNNERSVPMRWLAEVTTLNPEGLSVHRLAVDLTRFARSIEIESSTE
jgi:hypothetical protein